MAGRPKRRAREGSGVAHGATPWTTVDVILSPGAEMDVVAYPPKPARAQELGVSVEGRAAQRAMLAGMRSFASVDGTRIEATDAEEGDHIAVIECRGGVWRTLGWPGNGTMVDDGSRDRRREASAATARSGGTRSYERGHVDEAGIGRMSDVLRQPMTVSVQFLSEDDERVLAEGLPLQQAREYAVEIMRTYVEHPGTTVTIEAADVDMVVDEYIHTGRSWATETLDGAPQRALVVEAGRAVPASTHGSGPSGRTRRRGRGQLGVNLRLPGQRFETVIDRAPADEAEAYVEQLKSHYQPYSGTRVETVDPVEFDPINIWENQRGTWIDLMREGRPMGYGVGHAHRIVLIAPGGIRGKVVATTEGDPYAALDRLMAEHRSKAGSTLRVDAITPGVEEDEYRPTATWRNVGNSWRRI